MNKVYVQYYKTTLGELMLGSFNEQLCLCDWRYRKMRDGVDKRIQEGLNALYEDGGSDVLQNTRRQLEEYFSGERTDFDIPLLLVGTPFQKKVWYELQKVPFGHTESYLGLSRKIGDEKAIRSVASANGANAISILVPCHRIIGSQGKLTGYGGGIEVKRKLLQLEMQNQAPDQLALFG